jgi:hypothetical protein
MRQRGRGDVGGRALEEARAASEHIVAQVDRDEGEAPGGADDGVKGGWRRESCRPPSEMRERRGQEEGGGIGERPTAAGIGVGFHLHATFVSPFPLI